VSKKDEAKPNALAGVIRRNEQKPPRVVIYGPPKIGKTTFAAMAPNPIFLCIEEGLGSLEVDHFDLITSFDQVLHNLALLWNEEHQYQTVVLDSLDWLEALIWKQVALDNGKNSIEEIGYAKGYIFALEYWKQVLDGFNALREHKGMMPILISHSQVKPFNNPMTDPYDRYSMKLHEKARALVEEWAECILFAGSKVFTRKVDGKGGQKVTRAIGGDERILFTTESPAFVAGSRYALPDELPLNFNAFMEALAGKE